MSDKKIIAVAGATGAQGGGVVRAILNDPDGGFAARALTRNPDSDKAAALSDLGAEVVGADVDDEESIRSAYEGAYGAYCVTFFWEHFSPQREIAQAKAMADAAVGAGLQHVIWSTLEDTRRWIPLDDDRMPTLQERYKVPHFDAKGEADDLFREVGAPTTFLLTSFYWDNLIHFGSEPQRGEDGNLVFALPMGDKKLPGMAAEDIGKCAYGIFREGLGHVGETIGISSEFLTGAQMAAALSKTLGEEVTHFPVSFEMYRSFDFPGADDMGNMFQFKHDFQEAFLGNRSIEASRRLNPDLQSFETWLERNGARIPRH